MTDAAARMRDAGRSWTEISRELGIPASIAKAMVRDARQPRRAALARTEANERARGLLIACANCPHPRKDHTGPGGGCTVCGPARTAWRVTMPDGERVRVDQQDRPERPTGLSAEQTWQYSAWREEAGCPGFITAEEHRRSIDAASRSRRRAHLPYEAHRLGVERDNPISYWGRARAVADMPRRRLVTKVRRARRREEAQPRPAADPASPDAPLHPVLLLRMKPTADQVLQLTVATRRPGETFETAYDRIEDVVFARGVSAGVDGARAVIGGDLSHALSDDRHPLNALHLARIADHALELAAAEDSIRALAAEPPSGRRDV